MHKAKKMLNKIKSLISTLNSIKIFELSFDKKTCPPLKVSPLKSVRSKIIAIVNQKGGCGKTTTAINLSSCLVERGCSVLLIDFDPQAHATLGLGIDAATLDRTIYDTLLRHDVTLDEIVKSTGIPGLYVAPANSLLSCALVDLAGVLGRENILKAAINHSKSLNLYDYIVIDCSPSLSLLTINALAAATHVLIPIQTHYFSLEGLKDFLSTLNIVRERLNFDLKVLGILPTIFDTRLNINNEILAQLRGYFQGMILKTVIHMNVKLLEATLYKKPINIFDPGSRGCQDYRRLAQEIMEILESGMDSNVKKEEKSPIKEGVMV